jgi:hypothetical protein
MIDLKRSFLHAATILAPATVKKYDLKAEDTPPIRNSPPSAVATVDMGIWLLGSVTISTTFPNPAGIAMTVDEDTIMADSPRVRYLDCGLMI